MRGCPKKAKPNPNEAAMVQTLAGTTAKTTAIGMRTWVASFSRAWYGG